jgi:hypothetical protein
MRLAYYHFLQFVRPMRTVLSRLWKPDDETLSEFGSEYVVGWEQGRVLHARQFGGGGFGFNRFESRVQDFGQGLVARKYTPQWSNIS